MKTKFVFSFLLLFFFISCQKDSERHYTIDHDGKDVSINEWNIDPEIASSDWFLQYPESIRNIIAMELSGTKQPMTWKELSSMKREAIRKGKNMIYRAAVCPGFPSPNPEGDVILNSQADVDAFGALNCKEIIGELTIIDTLGPDPICDLSALSKIKSVGSSLNVQSDCLTSLSGLDNLKSIGKLGPLGFIGVVGDNLTDIEALKGLKTITGSINIISCPNLTQITDAFSKITEIASGKTTVPLTSVYVLNINNTGLTDLSGFRNIDYIEGRIMISNNGALQDLDDLSSLVDIGNAILLDSNASLTQVDRLSVISSLNDYLFVIDNTSLTSCCGLYNVLCANPPTCDMTGVVSGIVIINNNGVGCTQADIIAAGPCTP